MFTPDPERPKVGEIRKAFNDLFAALDAVGLPHSRAKSLMTTNLEEAWLWAYQALDPNPEDRR